MSKCLRRILMLAWAGLMSSCTDGDAGAVETSTVPAAPPPQAPTAIPNSPSVEIEWPDPGTYRLDQTEVNFIGFFRPWETGADLSAAQILVANPERPWEPLVAKAGGLTSAQLLPVELRADPHAFITMWSELEAIQGGPAHLLTAEIIVRRSGELTLEYVGASPGMIAMRGGNRKRGAYANYHAVESQSKQPTDFILGGLPPAQPGSLIVEFGDFLDEWVATRLTVRVTAPGSILLVVEDDQTARITPGLVVRGDETSPQGR